MPLFYLYLHVWIQIRIHKAPEYGSGSTTQDFTITGTMIYKCLPQSRTLFLYAHNSHTTSIALIAEKMAYLGWIVYDTVPIVSKTVVMHIAQS